MVKSGMKTAFVTLLACIVSLNFCFAGDSLTPDQTEIAYLKQVNTQLANRANAMEELLAKISSPSTKEQNEIIFLKHQNAQLEKQVRELQAQATQKPVPISETAKDTITSQNYEIITLRKENAALKSSGKGGEIADYEAAIKEYQAALTEIHGKYQSLVLRWNTQQAAIAQRNTAPAPPLPPVYRGKTDAQRAQETQEGIEFQLQQIQVNQMGQQDRAKYGY